MPLATLIHRHPMRAAAAAMLDAERALHEIERRLGWEPPLQSSGARHLVPRIDAVEDEQAWWILAELPGVEPAHLEVVLEDGVLTIEGERRSDGEGREAFRRRIVLRGEIDEEGVTARYQNGLLRVRVPRAQPARPEVLTIPVTVQ